MSKGELVEGGGYNEKTRKLVIQFARNGLTTDSTVDHASGAAEVPTTAGAAVTPELPVTTPENSIGTGPPSTNAQDHGLVGPVHF